MAVSDHTKRVLKHSIMEERVELRKVREAIRELERQLEDQKRLWKLSRDRIFAMQIDADEPIQVDPSDDFTC